MTWIVVNVGCIECGVPTNIVGVFSDRARAIEIAEGLDETHSWRGGGQNSFEVFPMPALDVVQDEYLAEPIRDVEPADERQKDDIEGTNA